MTRLETARSGRLEDPVPMTSFPFAHTIDVADLSSRLDEPSPCLPSATAVWYALRPDRRGRLVVDLAGSTPIDAIVRLYRSGNAMPPRFVGCASPLWNAQLSIEATVEEGETLLAQVGTSESLEGRLVVRAELRADAGR